MSLVASQTSSIHTHTNELCHDNTLIMVITTIFKYFTFKEKGITDVNARGTLSTSQQVLTVLLCVMGEEAKETQLNIVVLIYFNLCFMIFYK